MRIMLADDQDRVRYALRALLAVQTDVEVVAEATSVADMLEKAGDYRPDLILVDWKLPGLAMSAALPALHRLCPGSQIVVLSGTPEARAAATAAGADGFVSKSQPPDRLLDAIHTCQALISLRETAEI